MRLTQLAFVVLLPAVSGADETCPMHAQHMKDAAREHADEVKQRGETSMGFSQQRTVHHFTLLDDGGAIEVAITDAKDDESRAQIRQHLGHIAKAFAAGDFQLPMFIHAQTPPGVSEMKRLKARIGYVYAPTSTGGLVRISTKDQTAIAAIHAFLRFQIADHQTGDPTDVQ